MKNIFYIAEKPSQGRDIANALQKINNISNNSVNKSRYSINFKINNNNNITILWAIGHMLQLQEPHYYDEELKRWDKKLLPFATEDNFIFHKKLIKGIDKAHLKELNKLKNATEIIIATDAGREGELIAREIIEHCVNKNKLKDIEIKRMWTAALNYAALKEAIKDIKNGSSTINLYAAACLRERSDWIEGLNLTRIFTIDCTNYGQGIISIGRVQTPTLAIIVDRENEIDNFKSKTYYDLKALVYYNDNNKLSSIIMNLDNTKYKDKIYDKKTILKLQKQALENHKEKQHVLRTKVTPTSKGPPKPMDLAALQQIASREKSFSAKKTLDVAQSLYETHKAITYPRTSGIAFDPSEWDNCVKSLKNIINNKEVGYKYIVIDKLIKRKEVFSEKKLAGEDHHAIMPTTEAPSSKSGKFNADELYIYNTIVKNFIAQFMPDYEYNQYNITLNANDVYFKTTATEDLKLGWKKLFINDDKKDKDDNNNNNISNIDDKTKCKIKNIDILEKQTQPPTYYTEGRLIAEMKRLGIGTKATWAQTVELLKNRKYIKTVNKYLRPSNLAMQLIPTARTSCDIITRAERTKKLEDILDKVAEGKIKLKVAQTAIQKELAMVIDNIKKNPMNKLPDAVFPKGSKSNKKQSKKRKTKKK